MAGISGQWRWPSYHPHGAQRWADKLDPNFNNYAHYWGEEFFKYYRSDVSNIVLNLECPRSDALDGFEDAWNDEVPHTFQRPRPMPGWEGMTWDYTPGAVEFIPDVEVDIDNLHDAIDTWRIAVQLRFAWLGALTRCDAMLRRAYSFPVKKGGSVK